MGRRPVVLAPSGTAGFARSRVSGNSLVPRPPPRMTTSTRSMSEATSDPRERVSNVPAPRVRSHTRNTVVLTSAAVRRPSRCERGARGSPERSNRPNNASRRARRRARKTAALLAQPWQRDRPVRCHRGAHVASSASAARTHIEGAQHAAQPVSARSIAVTPPTRSSHVDQKNVILASACVGGIDPTRLEHCGRGRATDGGGECEEGDAEQGFGESRHVSTCWTSAVLLGTGWNTSRTSQSVNA